MYLWLEGGGGALVQKDDGLRESLNIFKSCQFKNSCGSKVKVVIGKKLFSRFFFENNKNTSGLSWRNQSRDWRHTVIISTIKNIDRVPYGRPGHVIGFSRLVRIIKKEFEKL